MFGGNRRLLDYKIDDFLLTLSKFNLRHISDIISDICGINRSIDDSLKLYGA